MTINISFKQLNRAANCLINELLVVRVCFFFHFSQLCSCNETVHVDYILILWTCGVRENLLLAFFQFIFSSKFGVLFLKSSIKNLFSCFALERVSVFKGWSIFGDENCGVFGLLNEQKEIIDKVIWSSLRTVNSCGGSEKWRAWRYSRICFEDSLIFEKKSFLCRFQNCFVVSAFFSYLNFFLNFDKL